MFYKMWARGAVVWGGLRINKVFSSMHTLTLSMLRLLSSNAQERKKNWKSSEPCHVGIHLIALAEYSQMSTICQGFGDF